MTDLITDTNSLIKNELTNTDKITSTTTSSTTPPSSTEEDSDENDHQTATSSSSSTSSPQKNEHETTKKTTTLKSEQLFPSPEADTIESDEQEKMETSQSSNSQNTLKSKFEQKFKQLIETSSAPFQFLSTNVWILNQIILPQIGSATATLQCGSLKIRFSFIENDLNAYQNQKKEQLDLPDDLTSSIDHLSADILESTQLQFKNNQIIQRSHIHTLYASNFSGHYSPPLILYSNEYNSSNLLSHSITKTVFLSKTSNGDLNDLNLFISWLKLFIQQQNELDNQQPKCLLINSFLYTLLFKSNISPQSVKQDLIKLIKENQIYLLFYPIDSSSDVINQDIFTKFKDTWKQLIVKYASKNNPNSLLALINTYKQTVRDLFSIRNNRGSLILESTFNNLFKNFQILDNNLIEQMLSHLASFKQTIQMIDDTGSLAKEDDGTQTSDETESTSIVAQTTASNSQNTIVPPIPKLTEQEITELTDWINEMSRLGCLCIRYTYLRDLQMKHRPKQLSSNREVLANDTKWFDLVRKAKLEYPNENEYLSKWFDISYWRQEYYKLIREDLKLTEAESLWTFDLIQFPYAKGIVHAPENDYSRRPKNFKPKISVIFAFNAMGDYLAPYFVYPTQFQDDKDQTQNKNECYSHNGYLTSRSFEHWLTDMFIPYLSGKQHKLNVLLYCGKLAVFDMNNLNLCKKNNIKPFGIVDEKIKPFSLLFQKSARKRQTDLFLDSWKKVTSKSGMVYQFKCASRQEFFHLFIDAFQNCIEETGNLNNESLTQDELSTSLNGSQSTAVKDFKNKMVSSFEQCQLWPIRDEDYKEYFELNDPRFSHINETNPTTATTKNNNENNNTTSNETRVNKTEIPTINSTITQPNEAGAKKRGRKKSVNSGETSQARAQTNENSQLEDETNNNKTINSDQSDHEAENENDSRDEPVNKRRKLSVNSKVNPNKKTQSYADLLLNDVLFQNEIQQIIDLRIKEMDTQMKKLTHDLIQFMFKFKRVNKNLSALDVKRKLSEKFYSIEQNSNDFLGNFLNAILSDSDLLEALPSDNEINSTTKNDNNNLLIQELNSLLTSEYATKF